MKKLLLTLALSILILSPVKKAQAGLLGYIAFSTTVEMSETHPALFVSGAMATFMGPAVIAAIVAPSIMAGPSAVPFFMLDNNDNSSELKTIPEYTYDDLNALTELKIEAGEYVEIENTELVEVLFTNEEVDLIFSNHDQSVSVEEEAILREALTTPNF